MRHTYTTKNTCSKQIVFDLEKNGIVKNVQFLGGGCPGNLQALPILVEGLTAQEIEQKLGSIKCGMRGTSCAAELAKAVDLALKEEKNKK